MILFCKNYILPYGGILTIIAFTAIINYAHAYQGNSFASTDDVMDLDSTEVASVVNALNPYTPVYQGDTIQVALAMKNQDYLDKPIIAETAQTIIPVQDSRKSTISYTVGGGDTLSSIGWNYGLKIATIKTVNNLTSDNIKPNQVLKLPPGDISPTTIKQAAAKLKKVAGTNTKKTIKRKPGSSVNGYPWGWCTYYVASRRYVPGGWGNASSWLSSAQRSGYATGNTPQAGAIIVTSESWLGHVAYVESVSGGSITISEMNARGWGITSSRTLSIGDGKIRGYIY